MKIVPRGTIEIYNMQTILNFIRKQRLPYIPLVKITIKKSALLHNYSYIKKHSNSTLIPVLKSNAYGHGLSKVAKVLVGTDCPYLAVDSYYEALILRNNGLDKPLLIIGFTPSQTIINNKMVNCVFSVFSLEQLNILSKKSKKNTKINLKFDTGMGRQGFFVQQLEQIIITLSACPKLEVVGVGSHLSCTKTRNIFEQYSQFLTVQKYIKKHLKNKIFFHINASAASLSINNTPELVPLHQQLLQNGNLYTRIGLALYGNFFNDPNLQPALSITTSIAEIKHLPPQTTIGYDQTYTTTTATTIAVIPVGYYEGIDRRLSNQGFIYIKNQPCRILGRVSMNITVVDVTKVPGISVNDLVEVFSTDEHKKNSAQFISQQIDTIPYELLVHIPERLQRVIV